MWRTAYCGDLNERIYTFNFFTLHEVKAPLRCLGYIFLIGPHIAFTKLISSEKLYLYHHAFPVIFHGIFVECEQPCGKISVVLLYSSCALSFTIVMVLGAFTKLLKSDYQLRHGCPSVCPHGTTRLSLEGFSWNFVFIYFSKFCTEFLTLIEIWQEQRIL